MRLRLLCAVLLANLMTVLAHAGTVTGSIQRPNGQPLANGVVTFSLSQAGVTQSGLITVTSDNVYCGTSSTGTVVGVTDPAASAVLSANYGAGTLPATQYFIQFTYTTGAGESAPSPETTFLMTSNGTLNGNAPLLQPGNATGYKVYIGATSGGETLQQTIVGFAGWSQSAALGVGTPPPLSNSTLCNTLIFNDAITPSYTTYLVNLLDSKGKQVGGYPQRYYFSGTTLDLSTLAPSGNLYARFPSAIVAQPGGNGLQSIAGPLSLGTNSLFAGTLNGLALNVVNAGAFSSTIQTDYIQSIINGCSPAALETGFGGSNPVFEEAIVGCAAVPSTATKVQVNGVSGLVTNSGTTTRTVGVFGLANALVANTPGVWGANFAVSSTAGFGGNAIYAAENDCNVANSTDICYGLLVAGNWSAQPTNSYGMLITQPGPNSGTTGTNHWPAGILINTGATAAPDSNHCGICFNPVGTGLNKQSQGVTFVADDPSAGLNVVTMGELPNGQFYISNTKAGTGLQINALQAAVTAATGTATVDLASVASAACTADSADVTLTGAAVGDPVRVTAATALPAGVWLIGRVTASNTGRFQLCNLSGGAVDRASDTYTISVVK